MKKSGAGRSPAGYIVFVFLLLGATISLSMCSSRKPKPALPPMAMKDMDFDTRLEMQAPVFNLYDRDCPVDNTRFKVPSQDRAHDNDFGGVASDLMKLALCPPEKKQGPPGLDCQQFDHLLGTCPTCGATFMELDLINMKSGLPPQAMENLNKHWDLKAVAPQLKALPQDQWTYDERALARYLTARTGWEGAPNLEVELGFAALQGAYSSNLSVYLGRDYKITGAAFYALAAAHFKHALDINPSIAENLRMGPQAQVMTAIEVGEMNRLLGRDSESQAGFELARSIANADTQAAQAALTALDSELSSLDTQIKALDHSDPQFADKAKDLTHQQQVAQRRQMARQRDIQADGQYLQVVGELEGYLKQGDHELHRFTPEGIKPPPVGWYVDLMLPGINGELDVQRDKWAALSDPKAIADAMLAEIGPAPAAEAPAADSSAPASEQGKPQKPPTM